MSGCSSPALQYNLHAMSEDHLELLHEAKRRAQRLVSELEAQEKEILANPPKLSADDMKEGRDAMHNAVAAARRTLGAIDDALKTAVSSDEKNS